MPHVIANLPGGRLLLNRVRCREFVGESRRARAASERSGHYTRKRLLPKELSIAPCCNRAPPVF